MGNAGICPLCGGTGWRWTGQAPKVLCKNCNGSGVLQPGVPSQPAPRDPITRQLGRI